MTARGRSFAGVVFISRTNMRSAEAPSRAGLDRVRRHEATDDDRAARKRGHCGQQSEQRKPAHAILLTASRANGARSRRVSIRIVDAIKPEPSAHCMLKLYAATTRRT